MTTVVLAPDAALAVDTDGDTWSDASEAIIGTDPLDACSDIAGEDAWPPDMKIDTFVDIQDFAKLAVFFGGPAGDVRVDIEPDPPDGFVDISDVAGLTNFFGKSCA